jgi:hypothetical protein
VREAVDSKYVLMDSGSIHTEVEEKAVVRLNVKLLLAPLAASSELGEV